MRSGQIALVSEFDQVYVGIEKLPKIINNLSSQ